MPDDINKNKGAGGDDAAAAAAADKATADAAAAAAAAAAENGGEETVTIKKADLKKIEDDRDNYKKIGLQKKADERDLHAKGDDGKGGDGSGQGSVTIDEKKISEMQTAATTKVLRDASEKTAKRAFLKAHSEYIDDAQWTAMMSHLTFKGGEVTHDEVTDRMEAAVLEHKRSTGKLDEYLKSEHERGVREGRVQGELGSGHGTGGAGDNNQGGKGSGTLSPVGEQMARAMRTDPEKVRKVDPLKDNVIDVTQPKSK